MRVTFWRYGVTRNLKKKENKTSTRVALFWPIKVHIDNLWDLLLSSFNKTLISNKIFIPKRNIQLYHSRQRFILCIVIKVLCCWDDVHTQYASLWPQGPLCLVWGVLSNPCPLTSSQKNTFPCSSAPPPPHHFFFLGWFPFFLLLPLFWWS